MENDRKYSGLAALVCLCPALAACKTALAGLGVGVCVVITVAALSLKTSLLNRAVPAPARLPVAAVIAGAVTAALALFADAFFPALYADMGAYLPLLAAYCIVLDWLDCRRETPPSLSGKIGAGLCLTVLLAVLGLLREFLGSGTCFGVSVLPESMAPVGMLSRAPGAFLMAAFLLMTLNAWNADEKEAVK